jgi:hypothetical protein
MEKYIYSSDSPHSVKMASVPVLNVDYEREYRSKYNEHDEQNFTPQEHQYYKFIFLMKFKLTIEK